MVPVAALIASAVLAIIGAVHLYWAAGGSFGKGAAVPSRDGVPVIAPRPVGTALVGVALFAMSALVAAAGGLFEAPLPAPLLRTGSGAVALVVLARAIGDFRYVGFSKRVHGSAFARRDTYLYSPLCLLLAALIAAVALG
jgi:hypothetical protein